MEDFTLTNGKEELASGFNYQKKEMSNKGSLVISLDFELLWGMLDKENANTCKERMQGARKAVVEILRLFSEYGIHATWGVVGSILNDSVDELYKSIPDKIPQYKDETLSSYIHYDKIRDEDSCCYFAKDLVEEIRNTPDQELASHTYSHYYCLADGQRKSDFQKDTQCFFEKMKDYSNNITSIIFPRNQINKGYVDILLENGFENYRGTEKVWCFQSHGRKPKLFTRAFRFADAYINLTGPNCYNYEEIRDGQMNNIRSSRFFRPYMATLSLCEPLKLRRIKKQMLFAAKNGKVFHLWWHPHNFGVKLNENIQNLRTVLDYYVVLKSQYGFESHTMSEVGKIAESMENR